MQMKKYKTILLDGDGVLWKSNQPLDGINDLFNLFQEKNITWALLTNNNSHTVQHYVDKFAGFGIQADPERIFSSSRITASYLADRFGKGASLHVVGSPGLITTLQEAGFDITAGDQQPDREISAVVAGMDLEINYQKIKIAMRLILEGAAFIATNTDRTYPTTDGISPATGMIIAALQACSGVEPYVVGKPYPSLYNAALMAVQANPDQALMVGDRLDTDILGANKLGIHTAAVLTGITSQEEIDLSETKPDFVFPNISALLRALSEVYSV